MQSKPWGHGSNHTRDPYLVSGMSSVAPPSLHAASHPVLHSHHDARAIYEEHAHEQTTINHGHTFLLNKYRMLDLLHSQSTRPLCGVQFNSQ